MPITTCTSSDSRHRSDASPTLRRRELLEHLVRDVEVGVDLVDVVLVVERLEQLEHAFGVVALELDRAFRLGRDRAADSISIPSPSSASRTAVRSVGSVSTRSLPSSSRTSSAPASIAAIRSSSP